MRKRLKNALAQSFTGAILVGWLFADGLTRFVTACIEPFLLWVSRLEYQSLLPHLSHLPLGELFASAALQLGEAVLILLIAWGLLRWLYYDLPAPEATSPNPAA